VAVLYYRVRDPALGQMVFVAAEAGEDQHFYGLPAHEYPGLFKVAAHFGRACDPDARDAVDISDVTRRCAGFVARHFPCLDPEPCVEEACMYTVTPDDTFVLDAVPGRPNIVYACGFSGTGFKMAPAVGKLLSQLLTSQPLDHDITAFSAQRFNKAKY